MKLLRMALLSGLLLAIPFAQDLTAGGHKKKVAELSSGKQKKAVARSFDSWLKETSKIKDQKARIAALNKVLPAVTRNLTKKQKISFLKAVKASYKNVVKNGNVKKEYAAAADPLKGLIKKTFENEALSELKEKKLGWGQPKTLKDLNNWAEKK